MQHNHILPFIFSNKYLYKYGVKDIKLKTEGNDVCIYVYYDISDIKNRKLFMYLLDKEKFLYNYYYDKYFIVKLLLDKNTAWYVKSMYYGGEEFISFHDLLSVFKKEIPAARDELSGLFLIFKFHYGRFHILSHFIWAYCSTCIYRW